MYEAASHDSIVVTTLAGKVAIVTGDGRDIGRAMIDTDFHNTFSKPEVRRQVTNITPLKREGKAQDVANLVAYLASDEAAFVTGANIDINGGTLFS